MSTVLLRSRVKRGNSIVSKHPHKCEDKPRGNTEANTGTSPETSIGTSPFPRLTRDHKKTGGIGHPQRAVRLYFRPKLVSVKRRDRSERPERLLFERSEFQTRQRTKGTE